MFWWIVVVVVVLGMLVWWSSRRRRRGMDVAGARRTRTIDEGRGTQHGGDRGGTGAF